MATAPTKVLRHRTLTDPQRRFLTCDARFRLFVGGVGSGKTRGGCLEVLRQPASSVGMVLAPTYPMLRDATLRTFMDLAQRGGIVKTWHKAEMTAELIDDKVIMFRSADNPDRLRGPNLGWFYADEGAMMLHEVWNIMLGRLREAPGRAWVTSTPRGMNWLHRVFTSGLDYEVIRSSTRDNPYLPAAFIASLEAAYTQRQLRQEVEGEFIDDVEGALWSRAMIDAAQLTAPLPDMRRVVVAIDPAVTSGEDSDETGIVVAGQGVDGQGYILADRSCRLSPDGWAKRAVAAFHEFQADRVVAETNNGGEMVEAVLRTVAHVPYTKVHASRGKRVRAEPVAALYEQGRVKHVAPMADLEDQLCSWTPESGTSPDRLDALVWALTELGIAGGSTGAYL